MDEKVNDVKHATCTQQARTTPITLLNNYPSMDQINQIYKTVKYLFIKKHYEEENIN